MLSSYLANRRAGQSPPAPAQVGRSLQRIGYAVIVVGALAFLAIAVPVATHAWDTHAGAVDATPDRIYKDGHYWIRVGNGYVHDPKCPMIMNDIQAGYNGYGQR